MSILRVIIHLIYVNYSSPYSLYTVLIQFWWKNKTHRFSIVYSDQKYWEFLCVINIELVNKATGPGGSIVLNSSLPFPFIS